MTGTALQAAAAKAAGKQEDAKTIRDVIGEYEEEFARALGKSVDAVHFVRGVNTALTATPELMEATEQSVMASVLLAAQLKLEIGAGMNQFHLTPREVSVDVREAGPNGTMVVVKRKQKVCVPIIGYQGFVKLAYNHPKVLDFQLARRYEKDEFRRLFTTERGWAIDLTPFEPTEEGESRGRYMGSVIRTATAGGGVIVTYLSRPEIEGRRPDYTKEQTVRSGNRAGEVYTPNTPWKTHYESMGDKTVMREHSKYIPKSIEMELAVALDGRVLAARDDGEIVAALPFDQEFGETAEAEA